MFKKGDEVEVIKKESDVYGMVGIIKEIYDDLTYQVEFHHNDFGKIYGNFLNNHLKPITPKPFAKDDLQDGDIVLVRENKKYIVFGDSLIKVGEYIYICDYDEDLTLNEDTYSNHEKDDIMQITRNGEVVYKREEMKHSLIVMHKERDGLGGVYNDKETLLKEVEKLINDKNTLQLIIHLEVK